MNRIPTLAILLTALVLGACGPGTATLDASMEEFEFDPVTWQVSSEAEVELNLTNDGSLRHNWVLMPPEEEVEPPYSHEEQGMALVEFSLRGGEADTFTFTAPSEPGEYPVLCTEGGHFEQGMVGILIVE